MSNLTDLIAQRTALEQQIAAARREGRAGAIAQIRALMAEHELTWADLGAPTAGAAKQRSRSAPKGGAKKDTAKKSVKGRKVAAKYRDPATGVTWSGRGLQPKWLKAALANGGKISDFAL